MREVPTISVQEAMLLRLLRRQGSLLLNERDRLLETADEAIAPRITISTGHEAHNMLLRHLTPGGKWYCYRAHLEELGCLEVRPVHPEAEITRELVVTALGYATLAAHNRAVMAGVREAMARKGKSCAV